MVNQSAALPPLSGHTISSGHLRLRLHRPLGNGVYGVVYLASDVASSPTWPAQYAVKVLLKHAPESDRYRQQWREINYHRSISCHPHVVTLHGVVEEELYLYLVMDFCPGGDLFSAIIDRQAFVANDARIKRVFIQLIDALHSCHDKGVFHRDLKPENILMSEDDDNLYIADFGLSTRNKLSGSFGCGSSLYMSPECIGIFPRRRPFDTARSDIWALGVVLINLITGRCPWHLASPAQDEGFRLFLAEGSSYLRAKLPISRATAGLLVRTFAVEPAERITLNELRREVMEIDTFFMFADPIPVPVPYNKDNPAVKAAKKRQQQRKVKTASAELEEVDLADIWVSRPTPAVTAPSSAVSRTPAKRIPTSLAAQVDMSELANAQSRDITASSADRAPRSDENPGLSSGSTDDSDEPKTPPSAAQEPVGTIPVSVMALDQTQIEPDGESAGVAVVGLKPLADKTEKKRESSTWRRLSIFMQKIRIAA